MSGLQALIKKDKFQVFLLTCPSSVPLNFASHPWFVINKQGSISRWEILFRRVPAEKGWGHLSKNFYPLPFQGIEILPFYPRYFWRAKLIGEVEGEIAESVADFIEKSPETYPYCATYSLTGPNSNTFAQWVLDNCPGLKVKLPPNSFGKGYSCGL